MSHNQPWQISLLILIHNSGDAVDKPFSFLRTQINPYFLE
jgi:hypothetical protein